MEDKILTEHPRENRSGVRIGMDRYEVIRQSIIRCLKKEKELTYTNLSDCVGYRLKGKFVGSIHWYVEVVKLDLEARKIIRRIPENPQLYRLI